MIRFLLLQNKQGKTRLSKWYVAPPSEQEKFRMESEIHKLILSRAPISRAKGEKIQFTNFVEYMNYKLVYRRYAGLYFAMGVDVTDNELVYLESIHLFVELLDEFFRNVCELDIVFNFNKVYSILDEYILAGEIQETSKREILERIRDMERYEKVSEKS